MSVGLDGKLLVALRNLDTVLCFSRAGGARANGTVVGGAAAAPAAAAGDDDERPALLWTLAASDELSDFAFARAIDKFYTPHSVTELADGRIALIDDGSSRPGCTYESGYAGCWSRAAIYALNLTAMTVALDWQFEDPRALDGASARSATASGANATASATANATANASANSTANASAADEGDDDGETAARVYYETRAEVDDLYNWDGGSVERLADGRLLVAFTSPYDQRAYDRKHAMGAWEVDRDGDAIVEIAVPHGTRQLTRQGAYRFLPWHSIHGEATEAPFAAGLAADSAP